MDISTRIVLASGSPRRKELLARAGYAFDVVTSSADEHVPDGLSPTQAARHVAAAKAHAVAGSALAACGGGKTLVISADTMVVLDGRIFGKPADADDARRMLHELSGRTHHVITGVCIVELAADGSAVREKRLAESTAVTFHELADEDIDAYVAGGEPFDKAGAYGIQGEGGALVASVDGDFDNVVGLPVTALASLLASMNVSP